jgi:hypothetical protein
MLRAADVGSLNFSDTSKAGNTFSIIIEDMRWAPAVLITYATHKGISEFMSDRESIALGRI